MKSVFSVFALSLVLMSFGLLAGSVFAQTASTGSIEGMVTDHTGAAVTGIVEVRLRVDLERAFSFYVS